MLKRVAAIGSSTAVIGALLTGALSSPAFAACGTGTYSGGGDGTSASPYLLSIAADVTEVKDTSGDWGCVFALTGDIDMGGAIWNGTVPETIGTSATKFTGIFDGGGFSITGLTINGTSATDYMGLFGYTSGATISNLGFSGDVDGDQEVGGLIGQADNTIVTNSWATGDVEGDEDMVGGLIGETIGGSVMNSWASGVVTTDDDHDLGGLIGLATGTNISGSWATGLVDDGDERSGGLIGHADDCTVNDSYATGNLEDGDTETGGLIGLATNSVVSGSWATGSIQVEGDRDNVGGLIGQTDNTPVANSWASGAVTNGDSNSGGLIGDADGDITDSYATGSVTASNDDAGGLVGEMTSATTVSNAWASGDVTNTDNYVAGLVAEANVGTIRNSWASGTVRGSGADGYVGGLVASTEGTVSGSYATGSVYGTGAGGDYVGGIVGELDGGTIEDSYATGIVAGDRYVGGLVGYSLSSASVVNSYSIGAVSAQTNVGGLIGSSSSSTVSSSYWNTETSGLSNSGGGTGKTTVEMREITTFVGWSISEGYNPASTWGICGPVNSGYPYLTAFNSSDPCVTPPTSYQFTFRLPDGTECGAIGPVGVIDGTIYILPGEDADCRTMEGALVGGWTIPVPEGYDSIGSPAMPFAPGQKVRVSDSQQFTVIPFEPLLSLTLDSNVMVDEACEANEVEFVDEANRVEYSWVPRSEISMARLPVVGACQPPGYTLAGWNTASDGSGTMFAPGAGLPSDWATDKTNRYRLFAIWSPA